MKKIGRTQLVKRDILLTPRCHWSDWFVWNGSTPHLHSRGILPRQLFPTPLALSASPSFLLLLLSFFFFFFFFIFKFNFFKCLIMILKLFNFCQQYADICIYFQDLCVRDYEDFYFIFINDVNQEGLVNKGKY